MNLLATQNHHQNHLKHPSKATNQWHLPKSEKQKLNFNTTYHFTQSVQSASLHITLPLRKSEAPHTWSGVARRFLSRRSRACRGRERWQAHFSSLVCNCTKRHMYRHNEPLASYLYPQAPSFATKWFGVI